MEGLREPVEMEARPRVGRALTSLRETQYGVEGILEQASAALNQLSDAAAMVERRWLAADRALLVGETDAVRAAEGALLLLARNDVGAILQFRVALPAGAAMVMARPVGIEKGSLLVEIKALNV